MVYLTPHKSFALCRELKLDVASHTGDCIAQDLCISTLNAQL